MDSSMPIFMLNGSKWLNGKQVVAIYVATYCEAFFIGDLLKLNYTIWCDKILSSVVQTLNCTSFVIDMNNKSQRDKRRK